MILKNKGKLSVQTATQLMVMGLSEGKEYSYGSYRVFGIGPINNKQSWVVENTESEEQYEFSSPAQAAIRFLNEVWEGF